MVEPQVTVALPPLVILVGEAVREAVGAGVTTAETSIEMLFVIVPPLPVQDSEKRRVPAVLNGPTRVEPDVLLLPVQLSAAVQLVALVLLHVRVAVLPVVIEVAELVKVSVGAGVATTAPTLTVACALAVPPAPVQVTP